MPNTVLHTSYLLCKYLVALGGSVFLFSGWDSEVSELPKLPWLWCGLVGFGSHNLTTELVQSLFLKKIHFLNFLIVLCATVSVGLWKWVQYLVEARRGHQISLELELQVVVNCRHWELNSSSPLQEQCLLLTTEPSPHTLHSSLSQYAIHP